MHMREEKKASALSFSASFKFGLEPHHSPHDNKYWICKESLRFKDIFSSLSENNTHVQMCTEKSFWLLSILALEEIPALYNSNVSYMRLQDSELAK